MASTHQEPTARTRAISAVIVAVIVAAAAAGAFLARARSNGADSVSGPVIQDITITGMRYSPAQVEVDASTPVVLRITNEDDRNHDLKIGSRYSEIIPPGATVVRDFGTFATDTEGWCTMASHKTRGMVFDVIVAD